MAVIAASLTRVPSEDLARFTAQALPVVAPTPAWAQGGVVVATCQRFEVYLEVRDTRAGRARLRRRLNAAAPWAADRLVVRTGRAAVRQLLLVAAGMDSVVTGETEVAGQVRRALDQAGREATPALRRLFEAALRVSKQVASTTALGGVGRSVAAVGLDLVEARHGSLAGANVVLVGTGSYAGVVAAELQRRGRRALAVHSTTGRARAFADERDATAIAGAELAEAVAEADLVVSCSGTGRLDATALLDGAAAAARTVPVLDLALGGEVPRVPELDVVGLDEIAAAAPPGHTSAWEAALAIVTGGVRSHVAAERSRAAAPAVTAIRGHFEAIVEREAEAAERRYGPETAAAVRDSLRRVAGNLLHEPSARAASSARRGELTDYLAAVRTLFGIEVPA